MNHRDLVAAAIVGLCLGGVASADVLTLRDGRRVQGTLVSIRDGLVEFEAHRGGLFDRSERLRVDRADVIGIEFEESRPERARRGGDERETVGTRPAGMREREIRVGAQDRWTDTAIQVRRGQMIYVTASGRVRWGPGRQDGPAGERRSPRNEGRPVPSRPAAALIGRVGDGSDYFFIGDTTTAIRMRDSGTLYLGINDDYLEDNSGSFAVTIAY